MRSMYITDIRHFLDDKGAFGPQRGPARRIAEFHAAVVAYATDFDGSGLTAPTCFKCKQGAVEVWIAPDDKKSTGRARAAGVPGASRTGRARSGTSASVRKL